jgi:hypothetical protein
VTERERLARLIASFYWDAGRLADDILAAGPWGIPEAGSEAEAAMVERMWNKMAIVNGTGVLRSDTIRNMGFAAIRALRSLRQDTGDSE